MGDVDFKCLTFKPAPAYSGYSKLTLSYTNDTQTVNYYNCLFLKTATAPTMGYVCVDTRGTTFKNKNFYNCSFDGSVSINALCGKVFAKNCAIYNSTAGETNEEDNLTSATFDTEYNITNGDNSLYGVYSGEYSWSGGGIVADSLLLKANDKYYSIKENYYDTATQQYKELTITDLATDIETYGFNNIEDLMTEVTIGSETFKPIDKFDKFSIVSIEKKNIEVQGLKDDKELIISNQNLSTVIASAIHNFVLDVTKMSNGNIKFVISDDNGLTWKTWNGTSWDTLTHTCPLTDDNKVKQYSKLSDSEKNKWNQLKEEIWTSGIETDTADIDYDLLDKNVRFAFVLYRPSYADKITLKNLSIVCDKIGNWHKLSELDIDIAINVNSCSVTAKQSNLTNVKVNILI